MTEGFQRSTEASVSLGNVTQRAMCRLVRVNVLWLGLFQPPDPSLTVFCSRFLLSMTSSYSIGLKVYVLNTVLLFMWYGWGLRYVFGDLGSFSYVLNLKARNILKVTAARTYSSVVIYGTGAKKIFFSVIINSHVNMHFLQ